MTTEAPNYDFCPADVEVLKKITEDYYIGIKEHYQVKKNDYTNRNNA